MNNPASTTGFFYKLLNGSNRILETRFLYSRYWIVYLIFLSVCLSLFFSFPRLDPSFISEGHWDTLLKQAHHPLFDPSVFSDLSPDQHAAKRFYRVTLPLLIKIFHLNITGLLLLQFALTVLNYYLLARFIFKTTANKFITTYLLFASALVFSFRLGFNEMWGHFDILPLVLITISLSFRNPFAVFLSVFFACWSDERALLASLITALYWYQKEEKITSPPLLATIAALVGYGVIRLVVRLATGYEIPMQGAGVGPECLIYTLPIFIPNLLQSLEGFWILVLLYLYTVKLQNKKLLFYGTIALLLATLAGSLMVYDIFRSLAYLTPFVYLCLPVLKDQLNEKLCFVILLCCFVYPSNPLLFNDNLMVSGNLAVYEIGRMIIK